MPPQRLPRPPRWPVAPRPSPDVRGSLAERVRAIVTERVGPVEVRSTPVDHHERLVWLATTSLGPVAVKADTSAERHQRELLGIRAAQRAGCPVPDVIDRVGGEVNVLVLRALDGQPLDAADDDGAWATVGAGLRDLHGVEPTGEVCTGAGQGADERVGPFVAYGRGGASAGDPLVEAGVALVHERLAGAVAGVQVHGDCQPDHFLLDGARRRVVGVLDFGDAGLGDPLWDVAVLTFDHPERTGAVLAGYADRALTDRAEVELAGYRALRCLTEIRWLTEHGYDDTAARDRLEHLVS